MSNFNQLADIKKNQTKDHYPCKVKGCKNIIFFSEKDLEYYVQNGWIDEKGKVNKPKKCKPCREKLKRGEPIP